MIKTPINGRTGSAISALRRLHKMAVPALLGTAALLLLIVPGRLRAGSGGPRPRDLYTLDMTKCAGFTAGDAAKILGLPASGLKSNTEQVHATLWICSFTPPDGKGLSFSVAVAKSAKEAAEDMEELRNNLEVAGGTAPFKDQLPNGAYSDIMGIGDDAVWTDVNGTLTVRKGNITVQVLSPPGKTAQIKVAGAFLAKF